MIYGYVRVSAKIQLDGYGLEAQITEIKTRYPNATIYEEQYTGTKVIDRPILSELLTTLTNGDTLVVSKLDRLARNTVEGIQLIEQLFNMGVSVHVLNVGMLENSPMGRFFLTTLLSVAEMERAIILERTKLGREVARNTNPNYREGRPHKYNPERMDKAIELLTTMTYREVSNLTGIPMSTLKKEVSDRKNKGLIKEWDKVVGRPKVSK